MPAALCAAVTCRPAEHGGPRQVMPASPVCDVCAERLGDNLTHIAESWRDLQLELIRTNRSGEMVSGTKDHGLVLNEAVSDCIRATTLWLWTLARTVIGERGFAGYLDSDVWTPGVVAAWLARRHVDWITHHTDEAFAVRTVNEAWHRRREVHRYAYPAGIRKFQLLTTDKRPVACPGVIEDPPAEPPGGGIQEPDGSSEGNRGGVWKSNGFLKTNRGGICGDARVPVGAPTGASGGAPASPEGRGGRRPCTGVLYATLRSDADKLPSELWCDGPKRHSIPPREWLALGRKFHEAS